MSNSKKSAAKVEAKVIEQGPEPVVVVAETVVVQDNVTPILSNLPAAKERMMNLGRTYTAGQTSRLDACFEYRNDCIAGKASAEDASSYAGWYNDGRSEPREGQLKGTAMKGDSLRTFTASMRSFSHPNVHAASADIASTLTAMRGDKDLRKGLSRASTQKDELALHYAMNLELAFTPVPVTAEWITKTVAVKKAAVMPTPIADQQKAARKAIDDQLKVLTTTYGTLTPEQVAARDAFLAAFGWVPEVVAAAPAVAAA